MIHHGDCRSVLKTLPDASVDCCITSPPYFALRDYCVEGQIGLEPEPAAFVHELVQVFADVRRVLKADGTLWLNLGDTYAAGGKGGGGSFMAQRREAAWQKQSTLNGWRKQPAGLKPKDLIGIPWMVAFALRADGWYLRSDIIWAKPNPMPESVTDRPTKSHEYLFLLSKSRSYHYDADAIREPYAESTLKEFAEGYRGRATKAYSGAGAQNASDVKRRIVDKQRGHSRRHAGFNGRWDDMTKVAQQAAGANKRSVWHIPTRPFPGAHFATFPEELVEPCVRAGCPRDGTVLDPFAGAGTVGVVCAKLQRTFIGIELNPAYIEIANKRIAAIAPLFSETA